MARETRGNGRAADVAAANVAATPAKRKRGASPVAPSTSAKATQQSPTSSSGGGAAASDASKGPSIKLSLGRNKDATAAAAAAAAESSSQVSSPEKGVNGDTPAKKQKISLKIGANGATGGTKPKEEAEASDRSEEPARGRILSSNVREALVLIMTEMATGLPAPMDKILSLWLPPSFKQEEQNTLGYILKQDDLTFEKLVDVVHLFAENLLEPCAYPNPMPPLSRLHLPPLVLPSHLYPHAIYNFCAALHPLMLRIEPAHDAQGGEGVPDLRTAEVDTERWALVQKIPGPRGESASEWFTTMVNGKEVEALAKTSGIDGNEEGGVLAKLAGEGRHFGYAQPLLVQTAIAGPSRSKAPTLADSVIRKASLKAQRWKEALQRQRGHFGSIAKGVTIPEVSSSEWTPSFGPMYDSTHASGGRGYWSTVDALHQAAKMAAYRQQAGEQIKLGREGWHGSIEAKKVVEDGDDVTMEGDESLRQGAGAGEPRDVDAMLKDNAALLAELREWQNVRVRNGQGNWVTERENLIAEEVSENLSRLAESVTPADLLAKSLEPGSAHELSKRIIHGSAPSLRGTLDPRRPRALHDNATVRLRPAPLSSVSSIPPLPGSVPGANLAGLGGPRPGGGGVPPYPTGTGSAAARYPNYRPPAPGHVSATPQRMAGPAYYPSPAGSAQPSTPYGARAPGLPQTPGTAYSYGQTPGAPPGAYPARPGPPGMGTPGAAGSPAGGAYGARNAPGPGPSGLRQPYPAGRVGYQK